MGKRYASILDTIGNTGIGLAMVCAQKGYPLVITMAAIMRVSVAFNSWQESHRQPKQIQTRRMRSKGRVSHPSLRTSNSMVT